MTQDTAGHTGSAPARASPRTPTYAYLLCVARPEGAILVVLDVLSPAPMAGTALVPGSGSPHRIVLGRPVSRRLLAVVVTAIVVSVSLGIATPIIGAGAVASGLSSASSGLQVLVVSSWPWLLVLVATAVGHYLLSALALRAAAGNGIPICWREATRVQVVAAAANRVTPSGLGAAAVNARFLARCGQTPSRSVGSVGAMHLFGMLAKSGVLFLLIAVGTLTGSGQSASIGKSSGRLVGHLPAPSLPMFLALGAALAVLAGVTVCCRARAGRLAQRIRLGLVEAVGQVTSMRRRPRDLALLLLASGGVTLTMGVGLVVSVAAVSGLGSVGNVDAVLVGYLVGTAVGTAVPTPSGIGTTEAALVAMLVATGLTAGPALSAVLLFRAITFWAPVPVGLLLARGLRHRHAL
jgi:uncharacterized protein (TIRG00374 family)